MNKQLKRFFNKNVWLACGLTIMFAQSAIASPEQERAYLLQILHQIDAMQPTILAAEQAQSKTARVKFHYTAYCDSEGKLHNGVSEDLKLIRSGIQEQLNHPSIEPRTVEPIAGNYRKIP